MKTIQFFPSCISVCLISFFFVLILCSSFRSGKYRAWRDVFLFLIWHSSQQAQEQTVRRLSSQERATRDAVETAMTTIYRRKFLCERLRRTTPANSGELAIPLPIARQRLQSKPV
jgi:hypothetical protein